MSCSAIRAYVKQVKFIWTYPGDHPPDAAYAHLSQLLNRLPAEQQQAATRIGNRLIERLLTKCLHCGRIRKHHVGLKKCLFDHTEFLAHPLQWP